MLRGWSREHNCHMRTVIRAGRNGNGDGVVTDAITLWSEHWNDNPRPFIWRAEANAIIAKTRRGRHALNHNTNSNVRPLWTWGPD